MGSFIELVGSSGPWAWASLLLYLALVAFLALVATLSSKAHRRKAALEVLRLLWVPPLSLRRDGRYEESPSPRESGVSRGRSGGAVDSR